jgi:thiol-disulfide isomerase/thioredoxin
MTRPRGAARHVALLLAALTMFLSGCSAPGGPAAPAAPAESTAGADTTVAALDFRATTLDGRPFDAMTLTGTPVVLWFWAPWCTICRAEAPHVAEVAAEYADRATFLGVPGLGEVADMREFVADTGMDGLMHVVDADGSLWQRFGVVSQPAYVFVGADGTVQAFGGSLDRDSLRQAADDLLAG